jgi:DNA/RNA endonuclease YhcR with UshA esterase domain
VADRKGDSLKHARNSQTEDKSMRSMAALVALVLFIGMAAADDTQSDKPLTVAEATKRIGEKVTVQLEVKSTGKSGRSGVYFLNSEPDYRSDRNFTVFIKKEVAQRFAKAGIEDPATHFKGKTIRVTGIVQRYRDKPEIVPEGPEQVRFVEEKDARGK